MLTALYADDWLVQLATLERAARQAQAQLYLLLDSAFLPGLHRKLAALSPSLLFESLPGCDEATRDVSPLLLACPAAEALAAPWLARCSGWPMLSAIATRESQAELAARLAAWCIVEGEGQRFNFRFPDTRRLPAIFSALTPVQQAQLAGPALGWSLMGRDGHWQALPVPGAGSGPAERSVALSDSQFATLVGDSETDEMLERLQGQGHQCRQDPQRAYRIVAEALAAVAGEQLDSYDKLAWCARQLAAQQAAAPPGQPARSMAEPR